MLAGNPWKLIHAWWPTLLKVNFKIKSVMMHIIFTWWNNLCFFFRFNSVLYFKFRPVQPCFLFPVQHFHQSWNRCLPFRSLSIPFFFVLMSNCWFVNMIIIIIEKKKKKKSLLYLSYFVRIYITQLTVQRSLGSFLCFHEN